MNFPFYIARRYLFSKKSHSAINLISGLSVCGVAFATMALVCTLSVFNGFQEMIAGIFTSFDPDLKITAADGKTFDASAPELAPLRTMPEVETYTESLEEQALLVFDDKQATATLKGVDDNFRRLAAIDSVLYGNGYFALRDSLFDYAILGIDLAARLGIAVIRNEPLEVYLPVRGAEVDPANPSSALRREMLLSPGIVFALNQSKYDSHYALTSISFVRRILDYGPHTVSAIELKIRGGAAAAGELKPRLQERLGSRYLVLGRYEQQAEVFRIMEIEKLISYIFLTFILLIACFNVIGSLSMLIIDKQKDTQTLRNLGADNRLIRRIFLFEGRLISLIGAVAGIALGLLLCFLQQEFGLVSLGAGGDEGIFVVDAYPVSVEWQDIVLVFFTVLAVGFLSVWYPIRYLSRKLLSD